MMYLIIPAAVGVIYATGVAIGFYLKGRLQGDGDADNWIFLWPLWVTVLLITSPIVGPCLLLRKMPKYMHDRGVAARYRAADRRRNR